MDFKKIIIVFGLVTFVSCNQCPNVKILPDFDATKVNFLIFIMVIIAAHRILI